MTQPFHNNLLVNVQGTELLAGDTREQYRQKVARITLDTMVQFVGLLDPQGTVLEINQVALDAVGIKLSDVEGNPLWTTFWWQVSPEINATLRECIRRAAQGEFVRWDAEIYGRAGGKETIIIDASLRPVKDEQGQVVFITAEGRDITEKKAYEREIAHKNQELQVLLERIRELDEIKTQFFANVSHELRTPLQLIIGPADRLIKSEALMSSGQRQELARLIGRNARMLLKHVNDLLDISKFEAGKLNVHLEDTDIASLLRLSASHFEVLAADRKIAFVVEVRDNTVCAVDSEKIQRVLMNLLSNAFKFVPEAGTVRGKMRASQKGLVLSVEDSGPGVRPELCKAIFERFRQGDGGTNRQFGGTGLGLAIAKEFVEMHKGTLEVLDSDLGGACFQVTLPVVRLSAAGFVIPRDLDKAIIEGFIEELRPGVARHEPQIPGPHGGKPAVLVVEDNAEMNRFIVQSLSEQYTVVSAYDGAEGLQKALGAEPDLIITDIMMPKVSGEQMIADMKEHPQLAEIPVLLLSAKADEELKVKLLEEGAKDFISKPFSEKELHVRVGNLVRLKQSQDTLRRKNQQFEGNNKDLQQFASIVESSDDAIISKDLNGIIASWNTGAERIFGYKAEEVIGKPVNILIPADRQNEEPEILKRIFRGERIDHYDTVRQRKDGSLVDISLTISPIKDLNGVIIGASKIGRDITLRKKAEQELKTFASVLEQKVRERTQLLEDQTVRLRQLAVELTEVEQKERRRLAEVLHDHLQQYLVAAKMRLGLVERKALDIDKDGLEEARSYIDQAVDASRQLTAELRPPVLYEGGLSAGLRYLGRKMSDQYTLKVHISATGNVEPNSDLIKAMIYQCVQELLFNTVKYAGVKECFVKMLRLQDTIQVTVEDKGRGFNISKLSSSDKGGFGLFSIRERMKAIGGEFSMTSIPGSGSIFTISVPDKVEASTKETLSVPNEKQFVRERSQKEGIVVLVADDHLIIRQSIASLLSAQPFIKEVIEAANGQEAVEKAQATDPDIILMDTNMPVMNGIEATQVLCVRNPRSKVIGLSVQPESEMAQTMKEAGAVAYFNKGDDTKSLIDTIKTLTS